MTMPERTGSPSLDQARAFEKLFRHLNERLFDGSLPGCVLKFGKHDTRSFGVFLPGKWERGEQSSHEISLNPQHLQREPPGKIAAILVHQMAHLWQHELGTPSRINYHNREWAAKMEEMGLVPTRTGRPGGKKTGQHVEQYVEIGGAFDRAWKEMPIEIPWRPGQRTPLGPTQRKYVCPNCRANVRGKPGMSIICGRCSVDFREQPLARRRVPRPRPYY